MSTRAIGVVASQFVRAKLLLSRDPGIMYSRESGSAEASPSRRASSYGRPMAKTLRMHRRGLLNWYDHPISTGPLEGIHNKIGALQRRAYGYRIYEHLKERLLTLHYTKYTIQG